MLEASEETSLMKSSAIVLSATHVIDVERGVHEAAVAFIAELSAFS